MIQKAKLNNFTIYIMITCMMLTNFKFANNILTNILSLLGIQVICKILIEKLLLTKKASCCDK